MTTTAPRHLTTDLPPLPEHRHPAPVLEPPDLADPDLDHLADTYDRYVQDLLDRRDELIAQHRTRSIRLECIEQDLMRLGVEL